MLAASLEVGAELAVAIEIDPEVCRTAEHRFAAEQGRVSIRCGDAFSPAVIQQLTQTSFDLVITNPPYVRYQSLSRAHEGNVRLPSGVEVRNNLLRTLDQLPDLDQADKALFRTLIAGYSGLSDLAVPAWILCALLTRVGGRLAMVVPEAWLTRDYAQIVQYLLLRWFRIRHVISDAHAAWFPDALVRTTLVVAERIPRKRSFLDWADESLLHVQLHASASTKASLVGNLYPESESPEKDFAAFVNGLVGDHAGPGFEATQLRLRDKAENLRTAASDAAWLALLEEPGSRGALAAPRGTVIAPPLRRWLLGSSTGFCTLTELGVKVGQGLRTGCNQFFYADLLAQTSTEVVLRPNEIFGIERVNVPQECALTVLRKQSEVGSGYQLESAKLSGRVLTNRHIALPEDRIAAPLAAKRYASMPLSLADFVRIAATTPVGRGAGKQLIPTLSAVRTNVRPDGSVPASFWYMLPPFSRRHQPDLFVARVNSGVPRTILNSPERVIIDANFSTIWLTEPTTGLDAFALLAVLNSTWCVAAMELTGSVMGGGALKLEATHLRSLPLPQVIPEHWQELSRLGRKLVRGDAQAREAIDIYVVERIFGKAGAAAKLSDLKQIVRERLSHRAPRDRHV